MRECILRRYVYMHLIYLSMHSFFFFLKDAMNTLYRCYSNPFQKGDAYSTYAKLEGWLRRRDRLAIFDSRTQDISTEYSAHTRLLKA